MVLVPSPMLVRLICQVGGLVSEAELGGLLTETLNGVPSVPVDTSRSCVQVATPVEVENVGVCPLTVLPHAINGPMAATQRIIASRLHIPAAPIRSIEGCPMSPVIPAREVPSIGRDYLA